ncbi:hypothetical protein RvY_08079 [Ramazzottius varieornatus]|uniref:AAA+ ATPase domain-containing protein n=1 Tax=Ramazzottius varieornatus TaxID=947166 RepID=A0A1D1VCR3_RAMVA|nr:hypothetical protein RvY_08079 [Ramazzottius varieornatus]
MSATDGRTQPLRERDRGSIQRVSLVAPASQKRLKTEGVAANLAASNKASSKTIRVKEDPSVVRPDVTFRDVGGQEQTIENLSQILMHLAHPEIYSAMGIEPPRGILLHGPPGSGKTLLANAIAGELDIPMIKVAAPEIVSGISGQSEEQLRERFQKAEKYAPCILFIDEIDSITQKRENATKDMERRIVAQLGSCLDDLSKSASRIIVIGATNDLDAIDSSLRRGGRFDREVPLGIPNEPARLSILKILSKNLKVSPSVDWESLAHDTPGYVGSDLKSLLSEAAMTAVRRVFDTQVPRKKNLPVTQASDETTQSDGQENMEDAKMEEPVRPVETPVTSSSYWTDMLHTSNTITLDSLQDTHILPADLATALSRITPAAKREGFITIPDVKWEDIGALSDIKEEMRRAILHPAMYPEAFELMGVDHPSGILLYGPPGCGKTLLAKAVANEAGLSFISVKGPELLAMYVGESERHVREAFHRGRNSQPCVIFFDEIDALCPRRSDGDNSVTSRVVNQMLTELDGLEARGKVFVIGATNRKDIVDPAILRGGRLGNHLLVDLPNEAARLDILKAVTKNGKKPPLDSDVDLNAIATHTQFFSGADLAALVREASSICLGEEISAREAELGSTRRPPEVASRLTNLAVKARHFEQAVIKIKPSLSSQKRPYGYRAGTKDKSPVKNETSAVSPNHSLNSVAVS